MHHNLKSYVDSFEAIVSGKKRHDVRLADRPYSVGDTVTLFEGIYTEGEFQETGRTVSAEITYIDTFGVDQGYAALSYSKVGLIIAEGAV